MSYHYCFFFVSRPQTTSKTKSGVWEGSCLPFDRSGPCCLPVLSESSIKSMYNDTAKKNVWKPKGKIGPDPKQLQKRSRACERDRLYRLIDLALAAFQFFRSPVNNVWADGYNRGQQTSDCWCLTPVSFHIYNWSDLQLVQNLLNLLVIECF